MYVSLVLFHQPAGLAPLPSGVPVWRTCLREVAFVGDSGAIPETALLKDGAAYALLVEIVCGLHSPIVGETEVQAQFKQFLASLETSRHGHLASMGQRVLADVKAIRHKYLQGVGAHSYGALAVSAIPAAHRIVLVGDGALAREVKQTVAHGRAIDQWTRRPTTSGHTHLLPSAGSSGTICADEATLVVAAPAPTCDLLPLCVSYPALRGVVDLRSASQRSDWPSHLTVVSLDDVFAAAERASASLRQIAEAREAIAELARAYRPRDLVRPLGWEDVCA